MPLVSVQDHDLSKTMCSAATLLEPLKTAVAHPCDESSLAAVVEAAQRGLMQSRILVGPAERIRKLAQRRSWILRASRLVDCPHSEESAARCRGAGAPMAGRCADEGQSIPTN